MKLPKHVGCGCLPDSASVLLIQTLLHAIRNKKNKPYYSGRQDGKQGPKTIAAIKAFQCDNCLPTTGKIENYGRTWNLIKQKTPLSVKNKIQKAGSSSAPAVPTLATSSSSIASQVKLSASKQVDKIIRKSPLPRQEARSLTTIVRAAGEAGIPLQVHHYDIDSRGAFLVTFQIDGFVLPRGPERQGVVNALITKINSLVDKNKDWTIKDKKQLIYASTRRLNDLATKREASPDFLRAMGLNPGNTHPIQRRLAGTAEYLLQQKG